MVDADWLADKLQAHILVPVSWNVKPIIDGREPEIEQTERGWCYHQWFTRSQFQTYCAAVQAARESHETKKACMELLFKLPQPTG